MSIKLQQELKSFQKLWHGGTSRPKLGWKKSVEKAKYQDLLKIVDICISPYVNQDVSALDIGAGGGFWTQKMLHANRVYCLDALSAKHNKFWSNIGKRDHVKYFQVNDFSCKDLPSDGIDYVFSYDVFCHISYSGARAYLKNLYGKLKPGANCFIMIADSDKYYNKAGRRKLMLRAGFSDFQKFVDDYDGPPHNGRWYFYGTRLFCDLLSEYKYTIVSEDVAVDADKLNPIIHFRK